MGEGLTTEPKARCKGRGPVEDDPELIDWPLELEFDPDAEGSIPLEACGTLVRNEEGGGDKVFACIFPAF